MKVICPAFQENGCGGLWGADCPHAIAHEKIEGEGREGCKAYNKCPDCKPFNIIIDEDGNVS